MTGIELIAAERARQVEQEGWTPEHDDEHTNSELALAACYYAMPYAIGVGGVNGRTVEPLDMFPDTWTWVWAKRSRDPIRNLVKAGALIAAEIDRLQRRDVAAGDEGNE